MKVKIVLGSLVAAMLMVGCNNTTAPSEQVKAKPTITEESLGLRKTDLYTENTTAPTPTVYTGATPGTSTRFVRAYDNAPPMIPHSVEGILPIEKNNNQCLGCHMPEIAPAMGATPIPKTHFLSWRPKVESDGKNFHTEAEVLKNTTFQTDLHGKLYQGRFNCSQCHAPQSQGNLAVENTFRPDYQSEDAKHRSSLLDTLNEGVH